jgi:hypothetical protein
VGPLGFTRVVAVKRLHPQFAKDPECPLYTIDSEGVRIPKRECLHREGKASS